jgi:pilus assembly protein CpaE
LLDLVGDYTLADVALNVDRLDMQFLRRSLCKHSSGLSSLSHPVQIADVGMIREDHLTRVIGLLRASYTHLILDLSKSFGPADITAMQMADVILLVAQLELSSLRNVVRILMALDHESNLSSKVKIVINRIGIENEIPIKQAEKTIEKAVAWQIPNDVRVIDEARNEGRPLVQSAPRNKVQQAIYTIAEALCGKPLRNNGKETSRGWSLFSLG